MVDNSTLNHEFFCYLHKKKKKKKKAKIQKKKIQPLHFSSSLKS